MGSWIPGLGGDAQHFGKTGDQRCASLRRKFVEILLPPFHRRKVRGMHKGQPHRALPIETDKVELKTGWLEPNISHTRANWARPRAMSVQKPHRRSAGVGRSWGNRLRIVNGEEARTSEEEGIPMAHCPPTCLAR
jgi:hypothetical protein